MMIEILFTKYEVLEILKKSENTSVYLCKNIENSQKVIVKVPGDSITQSGLVKRFKREGSILSTFDHENIVKVIDFNLEDDSLFIVLEYIEGKNLRYYINEGSLNEEEKVKIITELFRAVDFAHKSNVIHRDIKPENIFLDNSKNLKLGDFGLAAFQSGQLTSTHMNPVGTPCYMDPSQLKGEGTTFQTDIFSAGVVAYELLTGYNPFLGDNLNDTINKLINYSETEKEKLLEILPEKFVPLFDKILSTNENLRFLSAEEVLNSLSDLSGIKRNVRQKVRSKLTFIYLLPLFLIISVVLLTFFVNNSKNNSFSFEATKGNIIDSLNAKPVSESSFIKGTDDQKKEELKQETVKQEEKDKVERITEQDLLIESELAIDCIPWGNVYLNGEFLDITPLREKVTVKEGVQNIRIMNPAYPPLDTVISIKKGENMALNLNLNEYFCTIVCKIFPWGEVYLNGSYFVTTPMSNPATIKPGFYTIEIKNPEFQTVKNTFFVEKGGAITINYNFNTLKWEIL
ncbi:MAG: serine/threonine protein kinase [Ignavibacteriaceae bacterium]|nr:serine/threonine protein kinase [Ignavibacteriaceae bacterium]